MSMKIHKVGIIMNGVTGRMGTNQHLLRSIAAIINQGGVQLNSSETIMPDPVLVGRDAVKLEKLAQVSGVTKWTTDLDSVLKDEAYQVYFDSQTTGRRADGVRAAVKARKHIYCEKPTAVSAEVALELYRLCKDAGSCSG
jgi:predicted dehydrogenase